MTLDPGERLGPYEIVAPLGQGGMGIVFRARDTRLEREVAVKVLPRSLADDPEALSRFEREAKAVAALSHPNILAIHDFGCVEGTVYAAMELLEGETLRVRMKDGPLPTRKAIEIALAIARGLAAAHEKGIVHRDLKPENVFLLRSGQVKVLDFGLARVTSVAPGAEETATLSLSTEPGRIMGTVGYMAPEQVRGASVDARADIFSLGAVLFEMLTGKRAFSGRSPVETLSAILREDPPSLLESTAGMTPVLEHIVRCCLEKRPEERFRTAHDLALALDAAAVSSRGSGSSLGVAPGRNRRVRAIAGRVAWLLAGAALASAGALAWLRLHAPRDSVTFHWASFSGRDSSPAVSPDGRTIAFTSDRDGQPRIWLKQAQSEAEAPLTEGPDDLARFSHDGSELLFVRREGSTTSLFRAAALGGEARRLVEGASEGDWAPDGPRAGHVRLSREAGQIVTAVGVTAADGSSPQELVRLAGAWRAPRFSPDGGTIALVPASWALLAGAQQRIALVDLETRTARTIPALDARRGLSSVAWTSPDEIVYLQAESVVTAVGSAALLVRQEVRGGRVLSQVWSPSSALVLDVLGEGRIVFDTRSPRQNLREVPLRAGAHGRWLSRGESTDRQPVYSPDGERIAFSSTRGGGINIWLVSTASGKLQRITEGHVNWDPAFSADGRHVLWSSDRSGSFEIWIADIDGSRARQVTHDGRSAENPTMTSDGRWIVYRSAHPEKAGVWKVRADGTEPTQLVRGRVGQPEVSPDGTRVLYRVFAGRYPAVLRVARIADGGVEPFEIAVGASRPTTVTLGRARWMPDGRAIAFVGQDETGSSGLFVQDFVPGRDTRASRRQLAGFDPDFAAESFGVAADGSRLVIAEWVQLFSLMEGAGLPGVPIWRRPGALVR